MSERDLPEALRGETPGIPTETIPGESGTGDTFTASTEGGTAGMAATPVTPPGEGGFLRGPRRSIQEEEAMDVGQRRRAA